MNPTALPAQFPQPKTSLIKSKEFLNYGKRRRIKSSNHRRFSTIEVGVVARSTCDSPIKDYASTFPDELASLLDAIRNNSIVVLERR